MARYEHLPIFRNAYDLTLELDRRVAEFSRYHKYGVGSELREASRVVLKRIVKTNSGGRKRAALENLRQEVEWLKIVLRLAFECGAFPGGKKSYLFLAEKVVEVARQTEGWLKTVKERKEEP